MYINLLLSQQNHQVPQRRQNEFLSDQPKATILLYSPLPKCPKRW